MHHGYVPDGKLLKGLLDQRVHLFKGHLFVGFVIQIESAAASCVVPHHSFKYHCGSVRGLPEFGKHTLSVNFFADDRGETSPLRRHVAFRIRRTSTHRRQKRDLVSFFQPRIRPGKFLIDGNRNRSGKFSEPWRDLLVVSEDVAQSGMLWQVEEITASPRKIFQNAEK